MKKTLCILLLAVSAVFMYSQNLNKTIKFLKGNIADKTSAVREASGEYIIHLSADDVFYDSKVVSRIVRRFKERKCEVLGMLRLRCNEKLEPIRYMPAKFYQRRITKWNTSRKQYEAFVTGCFYEMASGSVLSYSKKYWMNHPFDEAYVLWEDGPFIADYLRAGNFLQLDYSFVAIYYREGGVSTSGVLNPLMIKDYNLYTKRRYGNIEDERISFLSKRIVMSDYEALSDKGIKSKIRRNLKFCYLIPMKIYYRFEQWLVYRVEMMLMKMNFINK